MNFRVRLALRCWQLALALCLIGVVLALLSIWGERRAAAAAVWRNPADDVQPAAIALDLALSSLAGVPDDQVLALAIEAGEQEAVRALLAFSPDLTDQERMNGWLWLGYRYQQAGQNQRAAQAYRLAGGGAILGSDVPALLRTETLLTVGQQLIALQDKPGALFYLKQAALIGADASGLNDFHRQSLLQQLIPASLRAGGRRDDWIALAKAIENKTYRGGNIASSWHSPAPGQDAELVQARDARRAAAAEWLSTLAVDMGQLIAADGHQNQALQTLHQALLAEEKAIDAYLAHANDPSAQETWLRWLLLKRRVASGGAGVGLVPEWETQQKEIETALTAAWADWLNGAESRQTAPAARYAILAAFWGLYPNAPVEDLVRTVQNLGNHDQIHLDIIKSGTPPIVGWREGVE